MDERKQPQRAAEPEPEHSDEAIRDLEPSAEDTGAVKGGDGSISFNYTHIQVEYQSQ